jgi:maltooligosyltrehalose synthase
MPVLRTGSYQPIFTEGQVVAYLRHEFEETVLVVINADDRPQTVTINLNGAFADQTVLQDQIGDGDYIVEHNALNQITIPPQSGLILA